MKVLDILTLNHDSGKIWLMCGEAGLDNEVKGIEVLETYDTAYLANPGDFVVTTGYCMSNGDASVENWIKIFLQRGVAGLGIKLGLFLDELPLGAYKTANENKFPILVIPQDLKHEDILRHVLTKLLDDEQMDIPAVDHFRSALNGMSEEGFTLDAIIRLLRKHIDCPIELVWNNSFDPINMDNALNAYNVKNFLQKKINKLHHQEPYAALTGNDGKYLVFKINSTLETMAFLTVTLKPGQSPARAQIAMIQEALPMLAVCLLSQKAPMPDSPKSPESFLCDIIDGAYNNREHEAREDASLLRMDFYRDRVLWMTEFAESGAERHKRYVGAAVEFFENSTEPFVYLHNKTALHRNKPIFVSDSAAARDPKQLRELLCGMRSHIRKIFKNAQCNVGVSETAHSLDGLCRAYDEAEFSLKMGRKLDEKSHIYFYDSYKIHHLLSQTWGMPTLSGLYKNTVGRLALHDARNGTDLVGLLLAMDDSNFNISRAAEKLGVNRKTLKNRFGSICQIVGLDLYQPENQIVMKLMSRMKKILA